MVHLQPQTEKLILEKVNTKKSSNEVPPMNTYYVTVILNELTEIIAINAEDYDTACQSALASYGENVLNVTPAL